jgi:hypothetical protein
METEGSLLYLQVPAIGPPSQGIWIHPASSHPASLSFMLILYSSLLASWSSLPSDFPTEVKLIFHLSYAR